MSTVHSAGPDKVFERLKKDSEDIDIALDQFMKEREAALNVQLHARNDYDNDMKRLDESDLLIDYEKMLRNTVDHNLMRHLNVAVEGTGNSIVGDEYGDGAFDEEEEQQPEPMPDDSRPNNYIETKRPMPSFEEKAALREQLFAFLDESRLQELQIDMKLMDLREQIEMNANGSNKLNLSLQSSTSVSDGANIEDSINYNFTIPPEEKRADVMQDQLFELQKRNSEKLKEHFAVYQPNPFGKAWGKDPDYIALSDKLKVMMQTGKKIKPSVLLNEKIDAEALQAPRKPKKIKKLKTRGF